jgi:hypothetical protein
VICAKNYSLESESATRRVDRLKSLKASLASYVSYLPAHDEIPSSRATGLKPPFAATATTASSSLSEPRIIVRHSLSARLGLPSLSS